MKLNKGQLEFLRLKKQDNKLSLEQLGLLSKNNPSTLSGVLNGSNGIKEEKLDRVLEVLDIDKNYFLKLNLEDVMGFDRRILLNTNQQIYINHRLDRFEMTKKQLAKKLNIKYTTLVAYLQCKASINVELLERILHILNITAAVFYDIKEPKIKKKEVVAQYVLYHERKNMFYEDDIVHYDFSYGLKKTTMHRFTKDYAKAKKFNNLARAKYIAEYVDCDVVNIEVLR